MKKILMSLGLGFSLVSASFANNDYLAQLNTQVAELLSPLQSQTTQVELVFDQLAFDEAHAKELSLHGLYRQLGHTNRVEIKLDSLSYSNEQNEPKTRFKGALNTDFSQVFPQEQINQLLPAANFIIEQIVRDVVRDYEDAASVKGDVTALNQDSEGNYTGLSALFSMKIDLNKLPKTMPIEEVLLTDAMVSFSLNITTGLNIDAVFISNPHYRAFQADERGLKEMIEQLLAADKRANDAVLELAVWIDELASELLKGHPNLLSYLKH